MPTRPSILHLSPGWLVVDKPTGWHSVDEPRSPDPDAVRPTDDGREARDAGRHETIASWLAAEVPGQSLIEESGLVHRLDRETSGCLLAARDAAGRELLRAAFSGRRATPRVGKTYLALLPSGLPSGGEWTFHFAGRHKRSRKVTVSRHGDPASRGSVRWSIRRRARTGAAATAPDAFDLVEIELLGPGRRHQIRAGFAALGRPLAGDLLYGGAAFDRLGLHAWRLSVDEIVVTSPPPPWE